MIMTVCMQVDRIEGDNYSIQYVLLQYPVRDRGRASHAHACERLPVPVQYNTYVLLAIGRDLGLCTIMQSLQ